MAITGAIFDSLCDAIRAARVVVTNHAETEMRLDNLFHVDVECSTMSGEVVEDYPNDYPFPSCLVFGRTAGGDPVHSVWAYNMKAMTAILVTTYRPDPAKWVDFRVRKKS